jgi:peptide/nickel transport system permease protein
MIPVNSYRFEGADIVYNEFTGDPAEKGIEQRMNIARIAYGVERKDQVSRPDNNELTLTTHDGKVIHTTIIELQKNIREHNFTVKKFLLGTDRYGRDLLSRLVAGTRVTVSVGLIAVLISLFIGITLGAMAGFFRGKVDEVVVWLINVVWSIPTLLLVIAITLVMGKGFEQVFIAVGCTMWVEVARIVRGQIFSIRELEFIDAGRALGFKNGRIILKHILPNIFGPVIVVAASNFSASVLLEAGLSFLGIGAQPPMPSWGTMIKENYGYIIVPGSAYLAVLPGFAIMLLAMAFAFVGNGLRDAIDSKNQVRLT